MTKMNHIDPSRAESRRPKPDQSGLTAPAAFQAKNAEIAAMLAQLQALSAADFEMNPNEIDWGHVGTLNHYASLLKRVTDAAFSEGEHAE
jgi:hypothetical protein